MDNQKNRNAIVGLIVFVFIVSVIIWQVGLFGSSENEKNNNIITENDAEQKILGEDLFRPDNADSLATIQGGTREKIKENISTPNAITTDMSGDVAIPTNVVETGNVAFRQFTIKGEGKKFVPSTIVVNEGDVVDLTLQAIDTDYSVFFSDFGVYGLAKKGETKKIQFQAPVYGQYTFVCSDVCGSVLSGTLIVNKKL